MSSNEEETIMDDEQMSSDATDDSSQSSFFENEISGFQFDPRLTQEEKQKREQEQITLQELILSRSKPVGDWCKCKLCFAHLNPIENVCCHDDQSSKEHLNDSVTCITMHEGFHATAMNEHVLNMSRGNFLQVVFEPEKIAKLQSNAPDSYRHLSYVNFRSWVSYGRKLGKGNRVVTPSCVVKKIRDKWPEPSGDYTGFRPSQNMIDDF